jgi:uncharacterized protein HemX
MSESQSMMSRVVAIAFFVAIAAGAYGFISHNNLKAAETKVVALEQDRDALKEKVITAEKHAAASATDARTCNMQAAELKTRAETAETALEDMQSKKPAKGPRSG